MRRRDIVSWIVIVIGLAEGAFAQTKSQHASLSDRQTATGTPSEEDDPFQFMRFGMTLESYYQFNTNRPHDRINMLRAYDTRANMFSIQQAGIVIESVVDVAAGRRFGARVDLQFGQATETLQGSPANEPRPEIYRHLWQAYGTYVFPVGRGLQTDVGKFASMLGYETNYAKDNSQFSRGYLFNFLPFYHTGFRATLPVSDGVTMLYMLTNGIQQTEDFNNFKSNHIAAILKPVSRLTWTVNYYFGQEQPDDALPDGPDGFFRVFDTNVTYTPHARWSLGIDTSYVTNQLNQGDESLSLLGLALYARFQASNPASLSGRYERLDDDGLFAGMEQVLHEATFTAEYKFADGFALRGELRCDWSNHELFTTQQPGSLTRQQNTVLVGGVWWFGNKQGAW